MRDMKMRHKEKCRNGKYGTKLQGWKMRDWKMWHKNAGLEYTAQEILGWKMRGKSVWKANRCFIYMGRQMSLKHSSGKYKVGLTVIHE